VAAIEEFGDDLVHDGGVGKSRFHRGLRDVLAADKSGFGNALRDGRCVVLEPSGSYAEVVEV